MRILFVDDEREPVLVKPDEDELGLARTVAEAKRLLLAGPWDELWLDHDLGWPAPKDESTTRPLATWIIENWASLPGVGRIFVHSGNPIGAEWLVGTLDRYLPITVKRTRVAYAKS